MEEELGIPGSEEKPELKKRGRITIFKFLELLDILWERELEVF